MPVLTSNGKPIFTITKKTAKEYDRKIDGKLFKSLRPIHDGSRAFKIPLEEIAAGEEELFFKYGDLFDQVNSMPPPKITSLEGKVEDRIIYCIKGQEGWREKEIDAVNKIKLEDQVANADFHSMVVTNHLLRSEIDELRQRLLLLEGKK